MIRIQTYILFIFVYCGVYIQETVATEYQLNGLMELNYSSIRDNQTASKSQLDSYLNGDYGKFGYDHGSTLSLSQAAIDFNINWENNFSFHLITNAYSGGVKDAFGVTETYLRYKGLPDDQGIRYQGRAGLIYPKISYENVATAWASPYTLNYSMINSWIGEEVRHAGLELTFNRLGKYSGTNYDWNSSLSLFRKNDSTGALLAWHGWNQNNRQTLWHEKIRLPNYYIRMDGQMLSGQADDSDPFTEIDGRTGYHFNTEWRWQQKLNLLVGYYDNRARPYIEKNGQYAWHTRFKHLGFKWKLSDGMTLIGQHLSGDTLMQSPARYDIVNNEYSSNFLMLTKLWGRNRVSARLENFKLSDHDLTELDDNSESGNSLTLGHSFRINKQWFIHSELNQIKSKRASRAYHYQSVSVTEKQLQFSIRYFF